MEFREGAEQLRALIAPETIGDVQELRERVEQIRIALEKHARANQNQQLLARTAVSGVVRYFDHGRPRHEREELLHALYRLERAAGVHEQPSDQTSSRKR